MSVWEYRALVSPHGRTEKSDVGGERVDVVVQTETILNRLGSEGWELVAAVQAPVLGLAPLLLLKRKAE